MQYMGIFLWYKEKSSRNRTDLALLIVIYTNAFVIILFYLFLNFKEMQALWTESLLLEKLSGAESSRMTLKTFELAPWFAFWIVAEFLPRFKLLLDARQLESIFLGRSQFKTILLQILARSSCLSVARLLCLGLLYLRHLRLLFCGVAVITTVDVFPHATFESTQMAVLSLLRYERQSQMVVLA